MLSELNVSPSFFGARYEIDVDKQCDSRIRQVIPTAVIFELWNKPCFFQRNKQLSYVLYRDYPENIHSLSPSPSLFIFWLNFLKSNDENEEQTEETGVSLLFLIINKDLKLWIPKELQWHWEDGTLCYSPNILKALILHF